MLTCLLVSRISTTMLYWGNVSFAVCDGYKDDCGDQSLKHRFCHIGDKQVWLELPEKLHVYKLCDCCLQALRLLSTSSAIAGYLLKPNHTHCISALQAPHSLAKFHCHRSNILHNLIQLSWTKYTIKYNKEDKHRKKLNLTKPKWHLVSSPLITFDQETDAIYYNKNVHWVMGQQSIHSIMDNFTLQKKQIWYNICNNLSQRHYKHMYYRKTSNECPKAFKGIRTECYDVTSAWLVLYSDNSVMLQESGRLAFIWDTASISSFTVLLFEQC